MSNDRADFGIQFGAEGLTIALQPGRERLAKCRLGTYYARLPSGGRSLFAPEENLKGTELVDLKVFVAEGKGMSRRWGSGRGSAGPTPRTRP